MSLKGAATASRRQPAVKCVVKPQARLPLRPRPLLWGVFGPTCNGDSVEAGLLLETTWSQQSSDFPPRETESRETEGQHGVIYLTKSQWAAVGETTNGCVGDSPPRGRD